MESTQVMSVVRRVENIEAPSEKDREWERNRKTRIRNAIHCTESMLLLCGLNNY